jgi:hypothetical protein
VPVAHKSNLQISVVEEQMAPGRRLVLRPGCSLVTSHHSIGIPIMYKVTPEADDPLKDVDGIYF